jgi:hypothetical protein
MIFSLLNCFGFRFKVSGFREGSAKFLLTWGIPKDPFPATESLTNSAAPSLKPETLNLKL